MQRLQSPSRTKVTAPSTGISGLPANPARRGLVIYNSGNVTLNVVFGDGGSTSDYSFSIPTLTTWAVYDVPITCAIQLYSASSTAVVYLTEFQ